MSQAEDLEAQGLICQSYDSLFAIRKRVRKINDIQIPLKRGLSTSQIGTGLAVFMVCLLTYGLLLVPIMRVLGVAPDPRFMAIWLLVPPILAGQQITKPMAYGKSISGSLSSALRFYLDDPIHMRGLPISVRPQPEEGQVRHQQREWVSASPFLGPSDADVSDETTEDRAEGIVVDLQPWIDAQAEKHSRAEQLAKLAKNDDDDVQAHFRRGSATTVYMPDEPSNEKVS